MRKVIITVGLGLMLLLPATAFAAKPKTAASKTTHGRAAAVKHAKAKTTAPKRSKRAVNNDRALMVPKWS
jgi:hypothetical protein